MAPTASPLGAVRLLEIASASIRAKPLREVRIFATVLLPLPIPPVRPMVRIGGLGLDLGVDVEVVVGLEVEGMDEIWNLGRMSSLPPPPLLVQASPNAITLANTAD
jgi:hypothetical protein